jgi:hypothetical protein
MSRLFTLSSFFIRFSSRPSTQKTRADHISIALANRGIFFTFTVSVQRPKTEQKTVPQ